MTQSYPHSVAEEKYGGKEVNKSGTISPVNILHYFGDRRTKSLTEPFFLNCIYYNPKGNSPPGDFVPLPINQDCLSLTKLN